MKNKMKKLSGIVMSAALIFGGLTGCGQTADANAADAGAGARQESQPGAVAETPDASQADQEPASEASEKPADVSGTITMAGSTSMEKFANALAESFMAKYPDVTVTAEFTGSSAGVESVLAESVDIGNSSRNLKEEEKTAGAVENIVAIDGIAVVTDPANTVKNLTKAQLISVYKGETKNWRELGGADQAVVVIGREAGSGTRGAFEELLEIEDMCAYANELDSTGAVMAKVASTPGAIGYVSLDVLDDTVLALSLDDVTPSAENIKNGDYFLSRPFVMATKGEAAAQSDAVKAMFDYLSSQEGRELVASVGLIAVD